MAETYRKRYDGVDNVTLAGGGLTNVATAVTFGAALQTMGANIATLGTDEYLPLVIENEIVYLTAYTAAATTGTISRGKEGTTGAAHSAGVSVIHGPTARDLLAPSFVGVKATRSAALTLASGVVTTISWDAEEYDTSGFHESVTNPSRITIPAGLGGWYQVGGFLAAGVAVSTARWRIDLKLNGTSPNAFRGSTSENDTSSTTVPTTQIVTPPILLAAGDFLEFAYFNGGSAVAAELAQICFWARLIGI